MTVFFYGCDMRLPGITVASGSSLQCQRERIIGHLKENGLPEFDQSKWYSDTGKAIFEPWIMRPGANQILVQARQGDMILVDKPERVVTRAVGRGAAGGGGRPALNNLASIGITIHTIMKDFPVIAPVDNETNEIMGKRYMAMLSLAKFRKTNKPFDVGPQAKIPMGWKVSPKGGLVPDRSERVIAINIYNCVINNFIPIRWAAKAFKLDKDEIIKACIAAENNFGLNQTIGYRPQAISAVGPTEPNARGILRAMCGTPLSLRELAFRTGVPALQLHYILRNLITANRFIETKGWTTFPVSKILVPVVVNDPLYIQITKVSLRPEAQTLILADSPLIDYEPIADSFSNSLSSARIFHELDDVGPPLPCRLSSLSQPKKDQTRIHAEPSLPPDREQDQPDEAELESLEP